MLLLYIKKRNSIIQVDHDVVCSVTSGSSSLGLQHWMLEHLWLPWCLKRKLFIAHAQRFGTVTKLIRPVWWCGGWLRGGEEEERGGLCYITCQ